MADYFIPLTKLFPLSSGSIAVEEFALVSLPYEQIGVRNVREFWNDTHYVVTGEAVLGEETPIDLKIFELLLGHGADELTVFRFELAASRQSIASLIAAKGQELFGVDESALENEDAKFQAFWKLDGPCLSFRLAVHDVSARLRLPENVTKATLVKNPDGEVVGLEPTGERVEIQLVSASLVLDTERGASIGLDPDQAIEVPPLLIGDSGVGLQIERLKIDLSEESGIPEVLSRPTYDESWQGVYIETARLFGLDNLLFFLPNRLELEKWLLDGDGITGAVSWTREAGEFEGTLRVERLEVELERNNFVRGVIETTFQWSGLNEDWADWHDLSVTFTLRHDPGVASGSIGFDIAVRSDEEDPDGLFTITDTMIAATEGTFGAALLAALWLDSESDPSIDQAMIATALLVASMLQAEDKLKIEEIKVVKVTGRYFTEEINGVPVRFIDAVIDARARISIDLPLDHIPVLGFVLPRIKTDRPIGLEIRGFTVRIAVTGELPPGAKRVALVFDTRSGISFDVSEQTLIENSPFLIVKAGLGRWDEGIWIDVGLKYAKDTSTLAVLPGGLRFWFLADGSLDDVTFQGPLAFSLLIPPSAYVKGQIDFGGDANVGSGRAYLLRKKKDNHEDRANWVWDLELALREETRDGVTSVVGSLEVTNSDGWPLSGSSALYGVSALLGINARPAVADAENPDYVRWYRELPPANRVIATKWALADGSEAAAFGVVIGSADGARAWSLKAGIIYASGVLIIPGTLNVLSERPKLDDERKGAFDVVLAFDWEHDVYAASVRLDYKKPEDGKLVHIHVPLDLMWRKTPRTWHVWVGEHMPVAKRVAMKVLDKFDGSLYFMVDRDTIANLGGTAITVGGTAKVVGGAAAFKWQLGKGRVKLFFDARLEFHIAWGEVPNAGSAADVDDRGFFGGMLRIVGGFGVKVFGMGWKFHVDAEMLWMTPEPEVFDFSVRVRIGLPWPIPDIKVTVRTRKGADGPLRDPGPLCAGMTLHARSRNAPVALDESAVQLGVPIDAAFTLNFAYPVRNAAASLGSFNFDSIDTSTAWSMSGGKGYAVVLDDLTLWQEDPSGVRTLVPGPFPALWLQGVDPAPGGKPARTTLQLFAYDGVMTSRYIGATADYVQSIFEGFVPCRQEPPAPVCYEFSALAPGAFSGPASIEAPPSARTMSVVVIPPPPGAEIARRYASLYATAASVADVPFLAERLLMLPATHGAMLPGAGSAPIVSERIELGWRRARLVDVFALRVPRDTQIVVRFFDGATLVREDSEGALVDTILGKIERVRFNCDVPSTRAEVLSFQNFGGIGEPQSQTAVYRVCIVDEEDAKNWQDGNATAVAWSQFWSDLYDAGAGSSSALLLEPGRRYALESKLKWMQVDGTTETPAGERVHTFRFETVPADSPPLERLRDRSALVDPLSWDIDTTPRDGALAAYRDRGITLRIRDPRLDAVYKAFGRRLVLRVVDDKGEDLFDRLAFLAEHAAEMPEYQEVWREIVLGAPCADGDHVSLWSIGAAHFGSLLVLDRGYEASLVPVPDPNGTVDLASVDWSLLPAIYSFRFRTSRWANLAAHVAAHRLVEEILDQGPDLSAVVPPAAALFDDGALEHALHASIGALPRPPAAAPEIVKLWSVEGEGDSATYAMVGLLIDGPEPIVGAQTVLTITDASATPLPIAIVGATAGTRVLVLFRSGGGVGAAPAGSLTIQVGDGVETATFAVPVAATPQVLAEEMAP